MLLCRSLVVCYCVGSLTIGWTIILWTLDDMVDIVCVLSWLLVCEQEKRVMPLPLSFVRLAKAGIARWEKVQSHPQHCPCYT